MKFITMVLSILLIGTLSFAQEVMKAPQLEPMDLIQTTSMNTQEITLEVKEAPRWNISLGMSKFERGNTYDTKGSGLTMEVQRRFGQAFFVGASYTNYSIESNSYALSMNPMVVRDHENQNVFTGSIELHPIRVELPKHSEFFAAMTAGAMGTSYDYSIMNGYFYGAGVGINYNNQIGLRADLKSNGDFKSFSSMALVGYY
ncbi:hypothetical protein [Bdellovibrio sp. HCB337]|uniref:hypothetical protein n=1 Tax=Bdellovibrio sp. HCB337 TaxID=3394358 RepID=UPI0039A5B125